MFGYISRKYNMSEFASDIGNMFFDEGMTIEDISDEMDISMDMVEEYLIEYDSFN